MLCLGTTSIRLTNTRLTQTDTPITHSGFKWDARNTNPNMYRFMKTNTEKITSAMDFGSPLNQVVILSAIEKYCEQVSKIEEQPENWTNGLISWEAWKVACKDVERRIFE